MPNQLPMTDAQQAVAQQDKRPFERAVRALDYTIRGLTLVALVPMTPILFFVIGMASHRSLLLMVGMVIMLMLIVAMLAISAIAPQLFTRRLPLSENARLLLSRVPVYVSFVALCYFGADIYLN